MDMNELHQLIAKLESIKQEDHVSCDEESLGESNFRHVTVDRVWGQVEKMLADKSST